ncbi:hypothetical protein N7457_002474 [Penicillium paradoxum]|uniref:uncharacterized protein n=1 Tax=Penicillium paradoxum TaxID=176176 RepID=UPI0025471FEF|nr:uncharacterized protein N7457_002474 [Penicillium paradoxum]KAJ5787484.1 hypothetical protein N7457_002474 [Penicillium paradoxum]
MHAGTRGKLTNWPRGLPLGYLNQLEQRLAETESALYGALMSLRSLGQSTSVQVAVKSDNVPKQKAARMAEWSQLPLRERIDMERWLTMMSDQFTIEPPRDVVPESSGDRSEIPATPHLEKEQSLGDEPRVGRVFNAWQPRDGGVSSGSPYSPHQCHPRMMGSLVYFGHPAVEGSEALQSPSAGSSRRGMTGVDDVGLPMDTDAVASGVETGQSSKADELSHNNPSLYF